MPIPRLPCALGLVLAAGLMTQDVSAQGTSLLLANNRVEYQFRQVSRRLYLEYVKDLETNAVTVFGQAPLWTMVTRYPTGAKQDWKHGADFDLVAAINPTTGGQALVATFTATSPTQELASAELTVSLPDGEQLTEWSLSGDAQGGSPPTAVFEGAIHLPITAINFSTANDILALPIGKTLGERVEDPISKALAIDMGYPARNFSMQFMALYDETSVAPGGLYFATHDSDQNLKRFQVKTSQSPLRLTLSTTQMGPDALSSTSYQMPAPLTFGPYAGDWYDACLIYRDWVEGAGVSWLQHGPVKSDGTMPAWIKQSSFLLAVLTGNSTDLMAPTEHVVAAAQAYRNLLPSVAHPSLFWFGWPLGNSVVNGDITGRTNFNQAFTNITAAGYDHIIAWMNAHLWPDNYVYQPLTGPALQQSDVAAYAYECEQGLPLKRLGFGQTYTPCTGTSMYMYPGEAFWRDTAVEKTKRIYNNEAPIGGRHFDFFTADDADFAQRGHPLGGGTYAYQDCRSYLEHVRSEMRMLEPEFASTVENHSEAFIGAVDFMAANLCRGVTGGLGTATGGTLIPMWKVVYSRYQRSGGSNGYPANVFPYAPGQYANPGRILLADSYLQALGFVYGNALGRSEETSEADGSDTTFFGGVPGHAPADFTAINEFLETLVDRYASLETYTRDGVMLRPLDVVGVDRTTDDDEDLTDPFHDWFNAFCDTVPNDMAYVLNSVWRSESGNSVVVILANWDDRDHDIHWAISGPDHGLDNPGSYIVEEFGGGPGGAMHAFAGTSFQLTDSVPAHSVKTYRVCLSGGTCD